MINVSEKVANSFRNNKKPEANPTNIVTANRRKLYQQIMDRTGSDPEQSYRYSMQIIRKNKPKLESYILSKNEVPVEGLENLVMQAYQIRCNEIDATKNILGVTDQEANIFLEDDESDLIEANSPEADNFAGELFAPVGIAAAFLQSDKDPDNVIGDLIGGVVNAVAPKVDAAALKRAAQNKKSGILGFLSGGKNEYETVRAYLQRPENAAEKAAVLAGTIRDVSQLKGFSSIMSDINYNQSGVKVLANDVIDEIARQKKREAINKALPFIIIGVIAIIVITILIVKNAKRN